VDANCGTFAIGDTAANSQGVTGPAQVGEYYIVLVPLLAKGAPWHGIALTITQEDRGPCQNASGHNEPRDFDPLEAGRYLFELK
jgi:hypothetical protein